MDAHPDRRRPTVSVIISTANRAADHVGRLLDRLRAQSYRPLEIVLVVGPCPEDMRALALSLDDVKVRFIDQLNLAYSRNAGIALASGDVLAFIDDDAVPGWLWLHELVEALEREGPGCVGIGGATVHANASPSPTMQNRNAIVHETGDAHACVNLEPAEKNDPDGPWFNRLHGCNMAFRRSAVESVGGFDESFAYQHEETDLCVRLIRAGYRIVHHPRAHVDHFPARSHFRRDAYDVSYFNILRSYTYFALKHARGGFLATAAQSFKDHLPYWKRFALWTLSLQISPLRAGRFLKDWLRGYAQGIRLGRAWRRGDKTPKPLVASSAVSFLPVAAEPTWEPAMLDPRRPLRIALLCDEFGGPSAGGVAVYTGHLAEGLARLGHDVVVFRSGYGPGEARPQGYRVVGVPAEADRPRAASVLRAVAAMHATAPFDVVESPLWGGEGAGVGVSGIAPLVVRLETPLEVIRQISNLPMTPDMIGAVAGERLGLSYASGVIAISGAIAATVEQVYAARLANHARLSTVIPIGLPEADSLVLDPIDPPDADGVRMLYVGRLEARKGILELGRAFAEAARREPSLRLWIAGADNSQSDGHRGRTGQTYEQTLRTLWGPELSHRVRFLGRIGEGHKNALLAQCDAFVAPSLYESFGIVFLEAMRLGKPVLGTNVGGIPEIVVHGETGLLVEPGDAGALAEAMASLAADRRERDRMGAAGLARFLDQFTVDAFARRSEAFYREVIAHWRGTRFAAPAADRAEPGASRAA